MAKYVLVCQKPTKYCRGCKITSKYGREKMRKGEEVLKYIGKSAESYEGKLKAMKVS